MSKRGKIREGKNRKRFYIIFSVSALLAVILVKSFGITAFAISSSSMLPTLLPGDNIIFNRAIYGAYSPRHLFFTNYTLPRFKMWGFRSPEIGDIVAFEGYGLAFKGKEDYGSVFVKRIIGLPLDTIQIIKKKVFVNGFQLNEDKYVIFHDTLERARGKETDGIFPKNSNWNEDNYGPVIIPKKDKEILLNRANIAYLKGIIEEETGLFYDFGKESSLVCNGTEIKTFKFRYNYYWVLGDNRDVSRDSRFFGFIREDLIIGRAGFIYFSKEVKQPDLFGGLRINRFFKIAG